MVISGALGKVVDAVVSLVMTSQLAPALKASNVPANSAWPAGTEIVALINFILIDFVVRLIVLAIEAMKRSEVPTSASDPQAQLASGGLTTQRNPIWPVEVSSPWSIRAAGR